MKLFFAALDFYLSVLWLKECRNEWKDNSIEKGYIIYVFVILVINGVLLLI